MNYLKLFELFDSELWSLVDEGEFSQRQSTFGPDVKPTDGDVNQIRKFFKGYKNPNWDFGISYSGNQIEITITNESGIGDKRFQLIINKSPDEWFWVKEYFYRWHQGDRHSSWRQGSYRDIEGRNVYESYYKCDDIEGLLDLVKSRREFLYKD